MTGAEYYKVYRDGMWIGISYTEAAYLDDYLEPTFSHTYQVFAIFGYETIAASPLVTVTR